MPNDWYKIFRDANAFNASVPKTACTNGYIEWNDEAVGTYEPYEVYTPTGRWHVSGQQFRLKPIRTGGFKVLQTATGWGTDVNNLQELRFIVGHYLLGRFKGGTLVLAPIKEQAHG